MFGILDSVCFILLSKTRWRFQIYIFFVFTPIPGEMIQFDEHIFQMGWFNRQLEKYLARRGILPSSFASSLHLGLSSIWRKRFAEIDSEIPETEAEKSFREIVKIRYIAYFLGGGDQQATNLWWILRDFPKNKCIVWVGVIYLVPVFGKFRTCSDTQCIWIYLV